MSIFPIPFPAILRAPGLALALVLTAVPGTTGIPESVHPDFELDEFQMPERYKTMGLGFLSDSTMVLATIDELGAGEIPNPNPAHRVLLIKGASTHTLPTSVVEVAGYWKQLAGLTIVQDKIFVSDRDGFYQIIEKVAPADFRGNRKLIVSWPDENYWNYGTAWHQWVFTPVYRDGCFYAPYSGSIRQGGWSSADPTTSLSGAFLKWGLEGGLTAYAGGLRSPNGANLNPVTGEIFVTDNQGSWLPASTLLRIRPNRFYGHRQSSPDVDDSGRILGTHPPNFAESLPYDPPVAWLPHGTVRSSPSQPVVVPAGMYAGDWLIGDVNNPGLIRVALDRVGEEINGAVFWFSKGFGSAALNRMAWDPKGGLVIGTVARMGGNWPGTDYGELYRLAPKATASVFDFKSMRSLADGLELEFTQPVNADSVNVGHFQVTMARYVRSNEYGQGKEPDVSLAVESVEASQDKKRIYLKIPGLLEDRVVYVKAISLPSSGGKALWNSESWFTLNSKSTRAWSRVNVSIGPRTETVSPSPKLDIRVLGSGILEVTLVGKESGELSLTTLDGKRKALVHSFMGMVRLRRPEHSPGVYILTLRQQAASWSRRICF